MFQILSKSVINISEISEIFIANVHLVTKRYAGHSKWQNIRHAKGLKDAQRANLFTKLGRQIKVAIQMGGSSDPKNNLKLGQVIDQAKRVNMPAASIQSVIKSCQGDKSQAKSYMIDIKGPGSCFILCEVYTEHLHALKQNIATILKKHQSRFADGNAAHAFEEKGIIEAEVADSSAENILEVATDNAIVAGAEDVTLLDDNVLQFICAESTLNSVVKELENLKYKIISAEVQFIPIKLQKVQESDLQICSSLYEKLESLPEIVRIADNVA